MSLFQPPRSAARILSWITRGNGAASIRADYEDIYRDIVKEFGPASARSWYWNQVLRSLFPFLANYMCGSVAMLKNHIKIAFRNFIRNKRYTVLNILGLAVGLAGCLLMSGYVVHELTFERMHPFVNRTFRINGRIPLGGRILHNAVVGTPFGPAAEESLPEVEDSVRILRWGQIPVLVEDKEFNVEKAFFTEPSFAEMFTVPFLLGDAGTALSVPDSVVLDQTLAERLFGGKNPLGKTFRLRFRETFDVKVTGVIRDMPSNTVLRPDMLISFSTLNRIYGDEMMKWESWGSITTFVRLSEEARILDVENKLTSLARSRLPEEQREASYYLQRLDQIYINPAAQNMNNDIDNSGSLSRIAIFSAIALLILVIAVINFVNLSTAKIAGRMKEVGIRKTCGASRIHLIRQFLMESFLLTAAAMVLGLFLFVYFKPRLDIFLGKTLHLDLLMSPLVLPVMVVLIVGVALLAGAYPAFYLSRFQAAVIFRSGAPRGPSRAGLRRILVGVQFFIAVVLIVCTLVVQKQVRYSENRDPGYVRSGLYVIHNRNAGRMKNADLLKERIVAQPGVLAAACLDRFPSGQNRSIGSYGKAGQTKEERMIVQSLEVDPDFIPAMGLQVVMGRNFEESRAADEEAVLLNERAVERFSLEAPLGKLLTRGDTSYRIIGVIKDWTTNSIHSPIYPVVIHRSDASAGDLLVRLPAGQQPDILAGIRGAWSSLVPGEIFDYHSIDDLNFRAFEDERRLASLLVSFCQLTVFVACLGIFGLAAFSTEQKIKEIGIRKVLGSGIGALILLLVRNYVRWVFVATLIAWPASFFIARQWLQTFAYRTSPGIGPFFMAGMLALVVAVLSVLFQTLRAALAQPIDCLRYE